MMGHGQRNANRARGIEDNRQKITRLGRAFEKMLQGYERWKPEDEAFKEEVAESIDRLDREVADLLRRVVAIEQDRAVRAQPFWRRWKRTITVRAGGGAHETE
jgi:tRNA(His) 5'-end guanylyltransferase